MNPMLSQRRELNMRKGTAVGLQSRRRRHLPEPRIISPMWSAGASHLRCFDWCPADPVLKSSFTCEQQCAMSSLPPTPSPSQSPHLSIAQSTNHHCGSIGLHRGAAEDVRLERRVCADGVRQRILREDRRHVRRRVADALVARLRLVALDPILTADSPKWESHYARNVAGL